MHLVHKQTYFKLKQRAGQVNIMTEEPISTLGGCMCGAVRYEAVGKPQAVGHCHCPSCRHHTGAPVTTFVVFAEERVTFTKGERKIYNSSPGVGRAFCGDCGTTLTYESNEEEWDNRPFILLHISSLDNPDGFVPERHWYHEMGISWFDTADDLPR